MLNNLIYFFNSLQEIEGGLTNTVDWNSWLTILISLGLSGVGIFLAYKSSVSLTKIEEQTKYQVERMNNIVDKLIDAQLQMLGTKVNQEKSEAVDEELRKNLDSLKELIARDDE
ncbi:MAG: hypothetical protein AAF901_09605 [Bacteroidota bacterium]